MNAKKIYVIMICVFSLLIVVSGVYLGNYYLTANQADRNQKEMATLIEKAEQNVSKETDTQLSASEGEPVVQPKYSRILELYPDFAGWITIPGTRIDYPVMQRQGEGQDYFYIDHDQSGEKSSAGTIFITDAYDIRKPSDNIALYGHNMKSGIMFHDLMKYREESFYTSTPQFTFNSLYRDGTYEVIAAFYTRVSDDEPSSDRFFRYYEYIDLDTKERFDEFYDTCKRLSLYEAGTAAYGDELLTLSTCSYRISDGTERFVVVAKRIKEE